jgi:hypothetical protein
MKKNKSLIKNCHGKFKGFLKAYPAEIMLIIGIILVSYATYRINKTLMFYLIGAFFIFGGLFIAKNR